VVGQVHEVQRHRARGRAWRRIEHAIRGGSASRTIGAGTIFFHAGAAGWTRPEPPWRPEYEGPRPASGAADARAA